MRKFVKRGFTVLPAVALLLSVAATSFSSALHAEDQKLPKDAEQIVSREMYQRGALTRFEIPETSKYGMDKVPVMEFDPAQSNQKEVVNAVGGYPSTILAETNSGKMLFIQNDGRQKDFNLGFRFSDYASLAKELDLKNAFLLGGGSSSTLIALAEECCDWINRPSDKDGNGNYGQTRTVVNSVILSLGADRNALSEETAKPDPSDSTPAEAPQQPKKGSSALWKGILIGGSVLCFIIAVLLAVRSGNKKYGK